MTYDILIVGGGAAGLTAATYARRAGKSVLVIEKAAFGGQITWSPRVENFPGSISVSGAELGDKFLEQAMEQGAEVALEEVVRAEECAEGFRLCCDSGEEFFGKALIVATGAKPRRLGLAHEEELIGSGVCFCAVCDGAFYKNRVVAVCGGGNSALQDALLLSEKSAKVYLIHRRNSFKGEARLVEELAGRDNVEFLLNARLTALRGEEELTGVTVEREGKSFELALDGLFVAVGHAPDNAVFKELIALDEQGYAASGENCETVTPGVFVAGDCRRKKVRQLTTACADGAAAALAACEWLGSRPSA